jgi:uncharacterized membrane protein SpoIIM required for sporulation
VETASLVRRLVYENGFYFVHWEIFFTIIAMAGAVVVFVVSMTFMSGSNRDDIRELKDSVKEVQMSIKDLHGDTFD